MSIKIVVSNMNVLFISCLSKQCLKGSLFDFLNLSCFRGSGIWFNSGAIFFELK